ncbi:LysM peptidoglycan-binding domain-containing protein [Streptomyces mirabilis]|uniref:LysM peptidoglycan-binding domain-containing protein n=1 Tax=Streptomyces mirabilis TaxID=68239 RepID=UPI0033B73A01
MSGDWLSKLAVTYLGDANRWPEIYDANKSVIEDAAKAHPGPPVYGTSDHGHWIFPGTALAIPGATCTSAAQPGLPEVQIAEASAACGHAILDAVGGEAFGSLLKKYAKTVKVPEKVIRIVDVTQGAASAAGTTIQLGADTPDGPINIAFSLTEAFYDWASILPGTPGLIGKIGLPVTRCGQAALAVDQQAAQRLGAQIRQALKLPPTQ